MLHSSSVLTIIPKEYLLLFLFVMKKNLAKYDDFYWHKKQHKTWTLIIFNFIQSIYNKTASFWGRSLCLSRTFWGEEPVSVSTQAPPPKWNMPKHAHHHQMSSPLWRNLWWRNNQHHHQISIESLWWRNIQVRYWADFPR